MIMFVPLLVCFILTIKSNLSKYYSLMVIALWFNAGDISSPIVYLNHVLYAHDFNLNLIFISKLCQDLKCSVVFSVNHCILQEMNTKRMIGLGSKENGMYRFHLEDTHSEAHMFIHSSVHQLKLLAKANKFMLIVHYLVQNSKTL